MFRRSFGLLARGTLPFQLMTVTRYENLARLLENPSSSEKEELLPPFFVSPKCDGVRCVSFPEAARPIMARATAAQKSGNTKAVLVHKKRGRKVSGHEEGEDGAADNEMVGVVEYDDVDASTTCYSRYGRRLLGLEGIEEELQQLRRVACDPALVLDGELVVEVKRTHNQVASSSGDLAPTVSGTAEKHDFFAAVGAVRSLKGSYSADADGEEYDEDEKGTAGCAGVHEQVGNLRFVIFDVISYQPRGPNRNQLPSAVRPGVTPFYSRLMTLQQLFRLRDSHKVSKSAGKQGKKKNKIRGRPSATVNIPENDTSAKGKKAAALTAATSLVKPVQYECVPHIQDTKTKVLSEYLREGYEGAVVRTATNLYRTTQTFSAARKSRSNRSTSVAKLVTLYDKEYQIYGFDGLSASSSAAAAKELGNLICMTPKGKTFKVSSASLSADQQKQIIKQLKMHGGGGASGVGLFVTLQYPALNPSGIPRFPRIKGIRGKQGFFV